MPVQSPPNGNEAGGVDAVPPSSSPSKFNKIPILNKNSRSFFLFLVATVLIIGIVVMFFLFGDKVRQQIPEQGSGDDAVLIVVGGRSITEGDLKAYDLIYNGLARFQQFVDEEATEAAEIVELAGRDEVLASLIRSIKIEILADREGVEVSEQDINAEIEKLGGRDVLEANVSRYGWSFEDWNRSIELIIREQKLNDRLTFWREAEFLALRFDVLPIEVEENDVPEYQDNSRIVLNKVKEQFENGENVVELAQIILNDEIVKRDFAPIAVQYLELSDDPNIRRTQRFEKSITTPIGIVTNKSKPGDFEEPTRLEPLRFEQHVLGMGAPTKSELWCDLPACYLIRVLDGSEGGYDSLDDWLKESGF